MDAYIKYLFLDIEGFTKGRTVEAQSDIINNLNGIVKDVLSANEAQIENKIIIPTGDGLCIALINIINPFDIHILLALDILDQLERYNSETNDPERTFNIRIGVNENLDILITDINGNQNVAGYGINLAQRIMNIADGGQIFVGETVYQTLKERSNYRNAFKLYSATDKHGKTFNVYQYTNDGHKGLNINESSFFNPSPKPFEIISDKTFGVESIAIDGKRFAGCKFDGTELVFSAQLPVQFENDHFVGVHWRLSGPGSMVMAFLQAMYHGGGEGGKKLVEATFEKIRKGGYFPPSEHTNKNKPEASAPTT